MTDLREQEMQNRIDALANEKRNLKEENQYLKEQIAQLKKMAFGSRTEKSKRVLGDNEEINRICICCSCQSFMRMKRQSRCSMRRTGRTRRSLSCGCTLTASMK